VSRTNSTRPPATRGSALVPLSTTTRGLPLATSTANSDVLPTLSAEL
jgi:hypothetical protein